SLKRLMAYSAILNMGYALVPLMIFDDRSLSISLTYVFIYAISTIGLFTAISVSLGSASDTGTISDLAGIARTKKATALIISICMFSMIGIPPFAGFFGKYYILVHALRCGEYLLAISMILTSVIAAYYYLNIVKSMYFCDSTIKASRDKLSGESLLLLVLTASFILLFSIFAKYSPLIINFS
ncbi:MAG: proton-conducting transporter membrane subunit, partial [Pseudomonadota bacterium]